MMMERWERRCFAASVVWFAGMTITAILATFNIIVIQDCSQACQCYVLELIHPATTLHHTKLQVIEQCTDYNGTSSMAVLDSSVNTTSLFHKWMPCWRYADEFTGHAFTTSEHYAWNCESALVMYAFFIALSMCVCMAGASVLTRRCEEWRRMRQITPGVSASSYYSLPSVA